MDFGSSTRPARLTQHQFDEEALAPLLPPEDKEKRGGISQGGKDAELTFGGKSRVLNRVERSLTLSNSRLSASRTFCFDSLHNQYSTATAPSLGSLDVLSFTPNFRGATGSLPYLEQTSKLAGGSSAPLLVSSGQFTTIRSRKSRSFRASPRRPVQPSQIRDPLLAKTASKVEKKRDASSESYTSAITTGDLSSHRTGTSDASASLLDLYRQLPVPCEIAPPLDSSEGSRDFEDSPTPSSSLTQCSSLDIIDLYSHPCEIPVRPGSEIAAKQLPIAHASRPLPTHSFGGIFSMTSRSATESPSRTGPTSSSPITPTQPLFDDLASAYYSITSRSMRSIQIRNQPNEIPPISMGAHIHERIKTKDEPDPVQQHVHKNHDKVLLEQTLTPRQAQSHYRKEYQEIPVKLPEATYHIPGRIAIEKSAPLLANNTTSPTLKIDADRGGLDASMSHSSNSLIPAKLRISRSTESDDLETATKLTGHLTLPDLSMYSPHIGGSHLLHRSRSDSARNPAATRKVLHHSPESTLSELLNLYRSHQDSSTALVVTNNPVSAGMSTTVTLDVGLPIRSRSLHGTTVKDSSAQLLRSVAASKSVAVPAGPLESPPAVSKTPSNVHSSGFAQERSRRSLVTESVADYGDTKDLLNSSPSSVEIGRGADVSTLSSDWNLSDMVDMSVPNLIRKLSALSNTRNLSNSALALNQERYLSPKALLAVSHDLGMPTYPAKPQLAQIADAKSTTHDIPAGVQVDGIFLPTPNPPSWLGGAIVVGIPQDKTLPVSANTVPVPAFNRRSVIPGSRRFTMPMQDFPTPTDRADDQFREFHKGRGDRKENTEENDDRAQHGYCDHDIDQSSDSRQDDVSHIDPEDEEAADWETIAGSRRTLASLRAGDTSIPDLPSIDPARNFSNTPYHPALGQFEHNYRIRSDADSQAQVLIPLYKFDGASFPNRNALTPPSAVRLPRSRQFPGASTPSHGSPFGSSPPVFVSSPDLPPPRSLPGSLDTNNHDMYHSSFVQWPRSSLSVVHEHSELSNVTADAFDDDGPSIHSSEIYASESEWPAGLSGTPGPELTPSMNISALSPLTGSERPVQSRYTGNSVSSRLMKKLRSNDHRMASTPLSYTNSFSKFSRLGARANVTGTPNGSGMQEVGGSVVGTSSPFRINPRGNFNPGPVSSPFTNSSQHVHIAQSLDEASPQFAASNRKRTPLSPEMQELGNRRDSFMTKMLAASLNDRHKRRSVSGQKTTLPLTLVSEDTVNLTNVSRVREPYDRPSHRGGSSNATNRPLLPTFTPPPKLPSPHLFHYRSPSSQALNLRGHKQMLSWAFFAVCALLPPLLVLYGYGYLDGLMSIVTKHEIEHFGQKQKQVAKWVGFTVTSVIVLTIVIFWVVLKTVPNGLPR